MSGSRRSSTNHRDPPAATPADPRNDDRSTHLTRQSEIADSAPWVIIRGVILSTRHFLVAIYRMDITCKHDIVFIQHAHCGLVGPDCKK